MLPNGYRGLVVCDTRRAEQWRAGLARAGFDVALAETEGSDTERGSWQVGVAEAQEAEAKALVAAVIQGHEKLPNQPFLSSSGFKALVGVFLIFAIVIALWLFSR